MPAENVFIRPAFGQLGFAAAAAKDGNQFRDSVFDKCSMAFRTAVGDAYFASLNGGDNGCEVSLATGALSFGDSGEGRNRWRYIARI